METINVYFTTFNCGRELVDVDHLASSLFYDLKTEAPPDLIVLSLQELAPLAYSFLGGSFLAPYFAQISRAVHEAVARQFRDRHLYVPVASSNVGMTAIAIFASQDLNPRIHSLEYAGIGVGIHETGHKGAVGVRMSIEGDGRHTPLTLIAAHLAPNENQCERRNQDWRDICEGLVFEKSAHGSKPAPRRSGDFENSADEEPLLSSSDDAQQKDQLHGIFNPPSHVIFGGDLNYRAADTGPSPDDSATWPQPSTNHSHKQHFAQHFSRDQLTRERKAGRTLHLLDESPVNFPPTYKFSDAAQAEARHAVESMPHVLADGRQTTTMRLRPDWTEKAWLWAEHRVPSWCDRVLFLAASQPKVHSYTALPLQPTSDHRPVAAYLSLPKDLPEEVSSSPFQIRPDWKERRAAARRRELIVGWSTYLAWTWEGELLLAGTLVGIVGGYLVLRALISAKA